MTSHKTARERQIATIALPLICKIIADAELQLSQVIGYDIKIKMEISDKRLSTDEAQAIVLQQLICSEFGVSWSAIVRKTRSARVVDARHAYCYLAYILLQKTSVAIGRELRRDHSTVLSGKRRILDLVSVNDSIKGKIDRIKKLYYENCNQVETA